MIYARQHLPGFVDGEPEEAVVEEFNDLMKVEWIARWKKHNGFIKFSRSKDCFLFAEVENEFWKKNNPGTNQSWLIAISQPGDLRYVDLPLTKFPDRS